MSKNKLSSRSNNVVSLTNGKSSSRMMNDHKYKSPKTSNINQATSLSKLFFILSFLPKIVHSLPVFNHNTANQNYDLNHNDVVESNSMSPQEFYTNLFTSIFLVLAGGVFAGLTLGLMGQDEVYLKVIATSGEPNERKYARKVLKLIGRGKHWVLVTLLLSNVITNETLPIVLDRCLGGGWPAVVTSTASIVIFGEVIPQSICVRYGLQVGALFSPFVLVLMYLMYPIAYPCALLLDHILGEDHGTVYKKSGLKTLVTLHKTMGVERLNQDEVTIISAVLDLKEKAVCNIMTPIDRVYTMSADAILDEKTVEEIFNAGFSRIPIHLPNEPMNFIGMLLVRVLISYDPEDALPVASFPLATLPETGIETSCLNILNYFQEGKSHMIVVSDHPGEPIGAIGVLTLEDVIEELIGEEIVDESDVYIDINKNIKRTVPGPLSKRNLTSYLHNLYQRSASTSKRNSLDYDSAALTPLRESYPGSPQPEDHQSTSNGNGVTSDDLGPPINTPATNKLKSPITTGQVSAAVSSPLIGAVDSTKNWKPKNPASNPLETNKSFVTIKRPNFDPVKFSVLPGPARNAPGSAKTYGAIHATETGALTEARYRNSLDIDSNTRQSKDFTKENHPFLLPEERETDVSEISGNHKKHNKENQSNGNGHSKNRSDQNKTNNNNNNNHDDNKYRDHSSSPSQSNAQIIPHSDSLPTNEYQESRSYRTGNIVESVINVQGVHKTIIEHISDDEDSYGNSSRTNSGRSQQFEVDDDDNDTEGQGLLSGLKKKNSSTTVGSSHSDESKSRFSVW